ncbi:DUF2110 family protein [Candidatus Bathyarchaeota archaeon]|nr:DUF2110 family protein [Candidatus Bathyarchaeota archaeon]
MPTVTLLEKAYDASQLKPIDNLSKTAFEGLDIHIESRISSSRKWIEVTINGEDEKIALSYLAKEIGLSPAKLDVVERFSVLKGFIEKLDRNGNCILVDVGISYPEIIDATIPLHELQAQLTDGRKVALSKIAELFGFCRNLPLFVKILNVDEENKSIEAMLAEKQMMRYRSWTRSLLDRLIVLGATLDDIGLALRAARCERDIVSIEPLGILEHAVTCKLGTDAAGLIPKIGRRLKHATLTVYNPRRIMGFLEGGSTGIS